MKIWTALVAAVLAFGGANAWAQQPGANQVLAGPTSGGAGAAGFRALVGPDLPLPGASSLGGVESITCATHTWLNTISTGGVPACAQPAASDLSNGVTGSGAVVLGTSPTISGAAISGGTITGLPSPSNSGDAATKQYVDTTASGLVVHSQAVLATAAALAANTYNNGASGVGATLTANANGNLVIDGTTNPATNTRVVVKNESTAANNGIYTVTTTGGASQAWVLTRATDANTPGTGNVNEIGFGSYAFVTTGTANANTSWIVNSTVTTIGTSAINWVLFSSSGNTTVSNSDSTLTISPNSGSIVASLNLAHANTWTATQKVTANGHNIQVDTPSANEVASYSFFDNGVLEWSIYKNTDLSFHIRDESVAREDMQIALNGNMSLMPGGGNIIPFGDLYAGSGKPWVDVKSGSHSCAAAAGDNSTNDQPAIQCQITWLTNNSAAAELFFPCGNYKITSTLTITAPILLVGETPTCAEITTGGTDITALKWQNLSAIQRGGGVKQLFIVCQQTGTPATPCVQISDWIEQKWHDYYIWGGNPAFYICGSMLCGGGQGVGDNTFTGGNVHTGNSAGISVESLDSVGDNFYDSKFDLSGGTANTALFFANDANGTNSISENYISRVDMSGGGGGVYTYSLQVNDSGVGAKSLVHMDYGVMGGTTNMNLGTFRAIMFNGVELGSGNVSIISGNLTVTGSVAGNGGGGSVTFSGGTRSCAGNIGVTC